MTGAERTELIRLYNTLENYLNTNAGKSMETEVIKLQLKIMVKLKTE